jgi:hypothetical protein
LRRDRAPSSGGSVVRLFLLKFRAVKPVRDACAHEGRGDLGHTPRGSGCRVPHQLRWELGEPRA